MRLTTLTRAALAATIVLTLGGPARPARADEFTVTRTDDTTTCTPGDCSLRGAIIAANTSAGPDVILLPAGLYILTIGGADGGVLAANDAQKGDLDIVNGSSITIVGDGPDTTIIDGNGDMTLDRVFDIGAGGRLQLGGATIMNGRAGVGFQSHAHGAGIHNHGSLILQNVVISDNRVMLTGWGGGGITNADAPQKASASLNNVTIRDNEALEDTGGGAIENLSFLQLENSTLANNRARNGGGIENKGVNALAGLTNVTISDNRAVSNGTPTTGFGGGISNRDGATLSMTHVTLAGNSADTRGGNLAALDKGKSVTPINTIFADGSPADCFIEATGGYVSNGTNLATDANCNLAGAGDRPGGQVQLGPLADNGGLTPTRALLPAFPDHGNEAIDACNPASSTDADQRGEPRPRDGDGDGTAICDMGAYEMQRAERGHDNDNENHDNDNHDNDND